LRAEVACRLTVLYFDYYISLLSYIDYFKFQDISLFIRITQKVISVGQMKNHIASISEIAGTTQMVMTA